MCDTCMCPVDGHRQGCPELEDDHTTNDDDQVLWKQMDEQENKMYGEIYGKK